MTATEKPLLQEGKNCWCLAEASRASVLVDTAAYFAAFAEACANARHQILILGWDFDRRERLHRGETDAALPDEIGAFLVALVRRRPDLRIYLLSWDFNMIYAAERELLPALRLRLQAPPRFHFRLDGKHPKGASHHQKVVVIDDRVAFAGGIDLSRWRWDTPEHKPEDPRRTDPNGKSYPPFHDIMWLVEGEVAARLGELARGRWQRSRGWRIRPVAQNKRETPSPWPESVEPQIESLQMAIARTEPAYRNHAAVHEVKNLYLDAIAGARRFIYLENQYLTATCLTDALVEVLQEPAGPEVVLVLPEKTGGWLEQVTMDVLRARMVERLDEADKHRRLRIYYPHQPGLGDDCISVHAKLLIVDDRCLRIGSSNTSNRSMGLDTECDLAIESAEDDDAIAVFIRSLRHQLLGEHLDCSNEELACAEEKHGLIGAIESLCTDGRSLRPLDCKVADEINAAVPDTELVDPSEPFSPDYFVAQYVPKKQRSDGRRRLLLFLAVLLGLLGLAAAWRWTSLHEWLSPRHLADVIETLPGGNVQAAVVIAGFVLASLLMVPITLLAVICGIVFGGVQAFVYALTGALTSAMLAFIAGRMLRGDAPERLLGERLKDFSKRLESRGTVAVALLRLVPVAPFTIFNLVAGISTLGPRQYFFGSLLGMVPGLAAITVFSDTLWGALTAPSPENIAITAAIAAGLLGLTWLFRRWLRSA